MLPGFDPAGIGADSTYPAVGVLFDGTNDYYTRGANYTGLSNGTRWLVSFWFRRNGGVGSEQRIIGNNASGNTFNLRFTSGNLIQNIARDTGGTTRLDMSSSVSYSSTAAWHHCIISINLTTSTAYMYVDDVSVGSVSTISNASIDFARTDHSVGADVSGSNKTNADLAEVFFQRTHINLSSESNRRKFISSSLRPVDLGSDGSIPLGAPPILFQSVRPGGVAADFTTNRGTGGGMTMTGTTTLSATNP